MTASFKGFASMKSQGRHDSLRLDECYEAVKWIDKKWVEIRVLPRAPLHVKQAWIKIYGGKEKKEINIPRFIINHNPETGERIEGVTDPVAEYFFNKQEDKKNGPIRISDFWLFNVIDRAVQEEGPPRKAGKPTKEEKKTGYKDINSSTWTPVRVARFTMTMIGRMGELSEDNIRKDKKTGKKAQYDASDAKYGFDVKVKFKKDAPGTDKYSIDKVDGGAKPLTSEEQEYLVWKLDAALLDACGRMNEKQAKEDFKRMELVGGEEVEDDDDEDDKPKKGKKSRSLDDDDDDKKSSKKSKKKPFDDDEDDKPKKKKGKKAPFDDDDEDDEQKKSKKSKKSSKKDDDDEPKKSKKSKDKVKSKDKSSKSDKKSKKDKDEKGGAKKKSKDKGSKKKKSSWDD